MNSSLGDRAEELRRRRVPYGHAQVVLAQRPTSVRPGDSAIVLADGTIDGFVGGECAESTVRAQALAVLDSGEPVVLRISPTPEDPVPGKVMAHNPCLSGGTMEIFLEPHRPTPLVAVFGEGPIAHALIAVGEAVGYELIGVDAVPAGATAVVVASHGRDETAVLTSALQADVEYVGLVASPTRGAAVVDALDVDEARRARVVTPAGLDIGATTPAEVALSILADIVARRPRPLGRRVVAGTGPASSLATDGRAVGQPADPVCGMTVAAADASLHYDHDGRRYFFCGSGCLRAFASEPDRYLGGSDA